jgi:NAD(P)-dependent dehydrogenase (short-subunit alcohol dehydrogenase family)
MKDRVLVAGAASGIGKAASIELFKEGYQLVLTDINLQGLQTLKGELPGTIIIETDLANEQSISKLINYLHDNQTILTALVDTVGVSLTMPLKSMHAKQYKDLFDINSISFGLLVSELLKAELFNIDGASVVVISSITGEAGARGKIAYGATKGAINSLMKSMAVELAEKHIRVNAICPGTIQSEMLERLEQRIGKDNVQILESSYPLRLGYPQDVAAFAVFLVSELSKWMTGSVIILDGGYNAI